MTKNNVPVAIVTGTIGAGKSTVAAAMSELLHEAGIRHGLVEVDSLGEVYPAHDPADPYGEALAMQMLATLWPQYLAAGITRAIVTMTLENTKELMRLLEAMGSPAATVVRLDASGRTRAARIKQREFGNLRSTFLEKTDELGTRMAQLGIGDVIVDNDDRSPVDTARDVLRQIGWM